MIKYVAIFLFLFLGFKSYAQDVIYPANQTNGEFKDLVWNRYTNGNFTILSIDQSQGLWLSQNIDKYYDWTLRRWGFSPKSPSKEIRIFCVNEKSLFKKMFNLEQSTFEIKKELIVLWVLIEKSPMEISNDITLVAIEEFENKHNVNFGWWFKKGCSILNGSLSEIKDINKINSRLKADEQIFGSKEMFTLKEDDYQKLSSDSKTIYDQQAMILCLMMRKEFGEAKLQGFLRLSDKNDTQNVLKLIYKFNDYKHFDKQYIKYMKELSADIINNKTPDFYLEVNEVK